MEPGQLLSDYLHARWPYWLPAEGLCLYEAVLSADGQEGDLEGHSDPGVARFVEMAGGFEAEIAATALAEADEAHDEEQLELERRRIERLQRIANELGLPALNDNRDLLELMRWMGLVARTEVEGVVAWSPVEPLPLPEDCFTLDPDERAEDDTIRWRGLHYKASQRIIREFVGSERTTVRGSLDSLAQRLDLDPEGARHGILVLLDDGDFTASADVERVASDHPFDLTVDWGKFNETRIEIVASGAPGE